MSQAGVERPAISTPKKLENARELQATMDVDGFSEIASGAESHTEYVQMYNCFIFYKLN